MKKLEKDLYIKHAKRLQAILNKDSTFVPYLNRTDFIAVIKSELNVLAACEKLFPKVELAAKYLSNALVKEFNTLAKQTFSLDLNFKYDDETDLIDAINYLHTFCNNIFKVDLDDLVEGKKVTASNPTIDLRSKPEVGEEPMMDAANAFNMGAMGYATNAYENPYLMGKAYAKLNKEIAEGKVYQYKAKPRAVPISKLILIILMGLTLLALVTTAIFCFIAHGVQFTYTDKEGPHNIGMSTIGSGIFYLITAGFGVYTFIIGIKSLIKKNGIIKNENQYYSFSWPFYAAFILLAAMIPMFDLGRTWLVNSAYTLTDTGVRLVSYYAWKYLVIICPSLAGLCIAPVVIGSVYAPKQDKEKLEKLLHQYIDEATKNGPSQPSMDVQQPIKVEPKKDDKPSKDTKTDKKPEKK